MIDILTAVGDFTEFKEMMVAHRKGRDNVLVVTSAPVSAGAVANETRGQQEAKKHAGGASSTGVFGVEETRGAGRRREASGAATAAESKW